MQTGELLTTKEAAEVLRVSHWTISAWLSQGKLQRTKVGGRTMINRADLSTVIEVGGKSRMRVRRGADADAA